MSKNPDRQPLSTVEENGMRVSTTNPSFKFPTEKHLKDTIEALADIAHSHASKPCETPEDCEMCFLANASAESEMFRGFVIKTMKLTFGPMAALIDPIQFYAICFLFWAISTRIANASGSTAANKQAEIEQLKKMFGTGTEGPVN